MYSGLNHFCPSLSKQNRNIESNDEFVLVNAYYIDDTEYNQVKR